MVRSRVLLGWCIVTITALVSCSGDDDGGTKRCTSEAAEYSFCEETVLYSCPAGDGSEVDATKVEDCSDRGLVCLTSTSNGEVTFVGCTNPPG